MADEHNRWLDKRTAERMLRGEPLDAVDGHAREQAEHLAAVLDALAGPAQAARTGTVGAGTATDGGTAGEEAALAAFREARGTAPLGARRQGVGGAFELGSEEPVRLGQTGHGQHTGRPRPARWGRPVRFGMAAALAGFMIGGVAVAAGAGVIPSPFRDNDEPSPASSVSAETSEHPMNSPEPGTTTEDPSEPAEPSRTPTPSGGETSDPGRYETPEGPDRSPGRPTGTEREKDLSWGERTIQACRDYRSGDIDLDKRRRLEDAAASKADIDRFCDRVLAGGSGSDRETGGGSGDSDSDDSDDGDQGGGNDPHGNGTPGPVAPSTTVDPSDPTVNPSSPAAGVAPEGTVSKSAASDTTAPADIP